VSWLQFHRISVVAVPANLAAAVALAPLLVLALAAAGLAVVSVPAAHLLGLGASFLGSYVALCAQLAAAVPGAQVTSDRGLAVLLLVVGAGFLAVRRRAPML
jgi:competence protein ComEC